MNANKLRIAQLAPLWIPVPPKTYGGIELMLANLIEKLSERNRDVTLFASGDSVTKAKLVSPIEKAILLQKGLRSPHASIVKMMKMIKERKTDFDIIHNHFNFFMFPLLLDKDVPPFLTTIHRPIDDSYADVIKNFPGGYFCAISQDAKQSAKEQGIEILDVVYNGIDVDKYEFNDTPEDYVLYLGRLNQEKGVVTALRVAKEAGKKIIVAGNMIGGEEWNYFLNEVQPYLNEEGVNFVGQADFARKIKLMKNAKALLFPIDRREPFGLVMAEAMACGTPVIAFNKGSVPEVVVNGKTGFIVENENEMVAAIGNISSINRLECRKHVEKNFTLDIMTDHYEDVYKKILNKS